MDRTALYEVIEQIWGGNQTRAAADLGISVRTLRAGLTDPSKPSYRPLNKIAVQEIREYQERFPNGITETHVVETIRILHRHMQEHGFSSGDAAAGILGAAMALGSREIQDFQTVMEDYLTEQNNRQNPPNEAG